ncbi:hypothetical protein BH23GEM2_BH23GEM2_19080 [soil metagenome]
MSRHILLGESLANRVIAPPLPKRITRRLLLPGPALGFVCALLGTAPLQAQADIEIATERGGVGLHLLVGAIGGRLELDEGPRIDALGGRIGLGFGELVQVTGFHWKSVDISDRPRIPARATGAEVQLNLNAGFGLTPFLSAGAARMRVDTVTESAAIAGAGVLLPLGPVLLRGTVHDYMLGVSGFRNSTSSEKTTHNWMVGVGVTAAFGRGRPQRRVRTVEVPVARTVVTTRGDTVTRLRNYQSERRIEVPLPLEGSITIRYGPDAQPIVVPGQPAVASQGTESAPFVSDPALQNWLRQEIGLQLAEELRRQRALVGSSSPSPATVERITDDVLATVLPRIESDSRQAAELREELRRLLAGQLSASGAAEAVVPAAMPRAAATSPSVREQPVTEAEAAVTGETAARANLEREARVRVRLAETAALQPALLAAAETERGPALVVNDAAFVSGSALLTAAGRAAVVGALRVLQLNEGTLFVQGHSDGTGTELESQRDSELRAEAVRALLVQEGIDPGRVYALGYGRGRPVAGNTTAAGRALNRRVEIVLARDVAPLSEVSP